MSDTASTTEKFNERFHGSANPWQVPGVNPETVTGTAGRGSEDIALWRRLIERIAEIAEARRWTKAEVARRMGMPEGTFSQWFAGTYAGRLDRQNERAERWLISVEEMEGMAATVPLSPPFLRTRTANEIIDTLVFAQMMPDFVTITAAAGTGKTMAASHFASTRAGVFMVTMSPHTKTVHGMLVEIATAIDVVQHNPAKLVRAIGRRLAQSGGQSLLIIDEAQNLVDDAVNQLRHFTDVYGCGIALIGNEEIYSRFTRRTDGPSYAQIKRRIGKRVRLAKARIEDIDMLLDAWSVEDADVRKVLTGIGLKDGALGQIDKTMKLATMAAAGQPVSAQIVRAAWANRDVEGL